MIPPPVVRRRRQREFKPSVGLKLGRGRLVLFRNGRRVTDNRIVRSALLRRKI